MRKESKYAPKLRELGFKPFTELHTPEEILEVDAATEIVFGTPVAYRLPRAHRRRLVAMGVLPAFNFIDNGTYATDETGYDWWANSHIDLTPFGFADNLAKLKEQARKKKNSLN